MIFEQREKQIKDNLIMDIILKLKKYIGKYIFLKIESYNPCNNGKILLMVIIIFSMN